MDSITSPARRRQRREIVDLDLPPSAAGALGTPTGFGLAWLLDKRRASDALAHLLRRALAVDTTARELVGAGDA